VILRPTAIYGPRDRDIFIMIKTVSQGFDPYIGRIRQQLSFVHGRDVADLAILAILNPTAEGIFHVTDGATYNRYRLSRYNKKTVGEEGMEISHSTTFRPLYGICDGKSTRLEEQTGRIEPRKTERTGC